MTIWSASVKGVSAAKGYGRKSKSQLDMTSGQLMEQLIRPNTSNMTGNGSEVKRNKLNTLLPHFVLLGTYAPVMPTLTPP